MTTTAPPEPATVEDVTAAIRDVLDIDHADRVRRLTPAGKRERAQRLADLHTLRATMWRRLSTQAYGDPAIPSVYGRAAAHAFVDDTNTARFWASQAVAK
jgi:hypothetical protein